MGKDIVPELKHHTLAEYNAYEMKELPALHSSQIRSIALSENQ